MIRPISKKRFLSGQKYTIKRSNIKPKKRNAKDYARIYGSRARVKFVQSLPCAACHEEGRSQNAHCPPKGERGTGYKADAKWIVPLCGPRGDYFDEYIGCHELHDRYRSNFEDQYPFLDLQEAAAHVEKLWQFHIANRSLVPTKKE